jgi:hypothetical protein
VTGCLFAATAEGLSLSGDLLYANANATYVQGSQLIRSRPVREIDVSGIDAIDSAGVAVLLALIQECPTRDAAPMLRGLPATAAALARVGGVLGLLAPR